MSKPTGKNVALILEHDEFSIRLARVGKGPLVQVWVAENGRGGRGMIMDFDQSVKFVEGFNDLLDVIEKEVVPG